MERIELKINIKAWFIFLIIFFAFSFGLNFYFFESQDFTLILYSAFFATVFVVGFILGIFYFYQKQVILTDKEIKKIGFFSKSIAYRDIQKIKVGSGGFSIYDNGKSPINVTTMYSNFDEAKKLLNQKIKDRGEIEIKGLKLFINKYIS